MGLWALAAAPAAGIAAAAAEASPGEFHPLTAASRAVRAAAAGVRASAAHAVFGLSNAAAKGTATARAALDVFGLESALAGLRGPGGGGGGGGGANAIGTRGGLLGAARSAAAALAAPAAAALDVSAAAAAALRAAAVGEPPRFARVRPPRRVDGRGRPLPSYDWREAAGLALLRELPLAGGGGPSARPGAETYLECRRAVVVLGGVEASPTPPAVRASEPGARAARGRGPQQQHLQPLLLPGRLVLVTEARILVAPIRPPPPPHGMRALAAAAAGAAAAAAAAHHHQFDVAAAAARRQHAAPAAVGGGRARTADWAAATADVVGVRVVSVGGEMRRVEVLALSPSPMGLSAAAAAGGGRGGRGRPASAAVVGRGRMGGGGGALSFKPFRSVVLDCESEADARALAAAVLAAQGGSRGEVVARRQSSLGGGAGF
jgi:hypothetical protein